MRRSASASARNSSGLSSARSFGDASLVLDRFKANRPSPFLPPGQSRRGRKKPKTAGTQVKSRKMIQVKEESSAWCSQETEGSVQWIRHGRQVGLCTVFSEGSLHEGRIASDTSVTSAGLVMRWASSSASRSPRASAFPVPAIS